MTDESSKLLNGWLAIAEHLGVEKTTAQRWERSNRLPVRRLPGKRGGVFAYAEELDRWREGGDAPAEGDGERDATAGGEGEVESEAPATATGPAPRELHYNSFRNFSPTAVLGVLILIVVVAAGVIWVTWRRQQNSGDEFIRWDGNSVTAVAGNFQVQWAYSFPERMDPAAYSSALAHPWTGDLDGDGRQDVLVAFNPVPTGLARAALVRLDHRGKRVWAFTAGREWNEAGGARRKYADEYVISGFLVIPDGAGGKWVVVSSRHAWGPPAQIALLDDDGKILGEFWHEGWLPQLACSTNERGPGHLLAVGRNAKAGKLEAVLIDPRKLADSGRPAAGMAIDPGKLPQGGLEAVTTMEPAGLGCGGGESAMEVMQARAVQGGFDVVAGRAGTSMAAYQLDDRLQLKSVERLEGCPGAKPAATPGSTTTLARK